MMAGDLEHLCEEHIAEFDSYHEGLHDEDDDHAHEEEHEEGDDHADDEHEHEEGDDHEHDHGKTETLGRLYSLDCGAGHDEHGEDEHDEDEHVHAEGGCDPHVWMDPHNVMYWTMLIRDTLVELDPTNSDTYIANAQAYLSELDALTHDFVIPLIETLPEENRILITNHDSLGYLAVAYEFEVIGAIIPGGSTVVEPSAQEIAELIDLIQDEGVPAVFGESTVSSDIAQAVADETGAELVVLYSGSLSDADGPAATYIDYIRYNYTAIVEALGGEQ